MKHALLWILVSVAAFAIGSLVTYPLAHRSGYENGYRGGLNCGYRLGFYGRSLEFVNTLQWLRAGDIPHATQFMEFYCFDAARMYYRDPIPPPGEANEWARRQGLDRWPDTNAARILAKELWEYRAAYRTNSAEWNYVEAKLQTQLAKVKSDDEKAWASIRFQPVTMATDAVLKSISR